MKKLLCLLALVVFIQTQPILAMEDIATLDQEDLNRELFKEIDQPEKVRDLIQRGANVNATNPSQGVNYDGKQMCFCSATPLIIAAKKGLLETCKILINNGANIDARSSLVY